MYRKTNPYTQYFIGMPSYNDKPLFDETTMTWFRKRLSPEMIEEVNNYITGRSSSDTDINDKDDKANDSPPKTDGEHTNNQGTLILDATCVPSDIRFSTDEMFWQFLSTIREKHICSEGPSYHVFCKSISCIRKNLSFDFSQQGGVGIDQF